MRKFVCSCCEDVNVGRDICQVFASARSARRTRSPLAKLLEYSFSDPYGDHLFEVCQVSVKEIKVEIVFVIDDDVPFVLF